MPRLRGKIAEPQPRSAAGPSPPHAGQAPPPATSRAPPLPYPAGSPALDTHRASPAPLNSASRQPPSTPSSRASSSLLPAPDDAGPLDAPLGRELAAAPRKANPSPARSTRAHVRPRRASGRAASERTPAPCLLRRGPPRQDPRRADRKARGRTPVLTALAACCPEGSLGTGSACPLPPAMKPVPPDPKGESARLPSLRTRLTGTPRAHTGVSDAGRSAARHCSPQRPPRPAMSHGVGTSGVDKHEGLWAAHPCGSLPGRPQATTCDPRVPREPGSPARDAYVQQGCHLHSGRLSKVTAQHLVPRAGHGESVDRARDRAACSGWRTVLLRRCSPRSGEAHTQGPRGPRDRGPSRDTVQLLTRPSGQGWDGTNWSSFAGAIIGFCRQPGAEHSVPPSGHCRPPPVTRTAPRAREGAAMAGWRGRGWEGPGSISGAQIETHGLPRGPELPSLPSLAAPSRRGPGDVSSGCR